ncbi:MAG TPA: hypothetical protein DEO86_20445 [Colwellia sp.]|nr:hypothetical protein [Colwellia sp.]
MINFKRSSIWGVSGISIGLCTFLFNYYMVPVSLPGYSVLVYPAIFTLSFFSEETYFAPKMVLFMSGQFVGYFFIGSLVQLIKKLNVRKNQS